MKKTKANKEESPNKDLKDMLMTHNIGDIIKDNIKN